MKRLLLLRHAKAVPDIPGLDDFDRVLADRGRADAVRMGHYLKEEGLVPGLVLCSPAARTRQTLELIQPALKGAPGMRNVPELYLAKAVKIVETIRASHASVRTLMVVGHNPGLEYCARALIRRPAGRKACKLYETMTEKFPTAALAVIGFRLSDWAALEPDTGELERFVRPKDLRSEDQRSSNSK